MGHPPNKSPALAKIALERGTQTNYSAIHESLATALRTPTGAAAGHAAVAASVPRHDGAADVAAGSVSHVDQFFERVGCVHVSGGGAAGGTPIARISSGGRNRRSLTG
jgi:hypothetical protein